jgi:hypothetical protein
LILSWAFVRITDTVYQLAVSASENGGQYSFDNAMLIYLFMTAVLLGAGFLLVAKFHRIGCWMAGRRRTANKILLSASDPSTVALKKGSALR